MYAVARRRHSKAKVRRSFIITTTVTSSREQHPRSHHKGATARVRTGDQQYPVLCNCQLGQDTDDTIQVSKVRIIRPEKKYAVAPEMSHLHLYASVCIYMQKICKICRHEIHKQNMPKICTTFPVLVWPGPDSNWPGPGAAACVTVPSSSAGHKPSKSADSDFAIWARPLGITIGVTNRASPGP